MIPLPLFQCNALPCRWVTRLLVIALWLLVATLSALHLHASYQQQRVQKQSALGEQLLPLLVESAMERKLNRDEVFTPSPPLARQLDEGAGRLRIYDRQEQHLLGEWGDDPAIHLQKRVARQPNALLTLVYHHENLYYQLDYPLTYPPETWLKSNLFLLLAHLFILLFCIISGLFLLHLARQLGESNTQFQQVTAAEEAIRQRYEEALRVRNTILNNSAIAILLEKDGVVTWVSPHLQRILGYQEHELVGREVHTLYADSASYQQLQQDATATLQQGISYRMECRLRRKDRRTLWCLVSGQALEPQRLSSGVIWIILDIDARKDYEQQLDQARRQAEEANLAKSQFLTNMSHELRTPLNAILGYSRILQRQPERVQDAAQVIERSGSHLLELINDLLDLAKIEAGYLELLLQPFALDRLLQELAALIRVRANEQKLHFALDIAPEANKVILGDQKRLRQILLNLLGNAVKFTEYGTVALRVRLLPPLHPDHLHIAFVVEDSGMGISIEQRERIFQAFEQGSSAASSDEPGSGLGLAISRRLVRLMGGDISLTSGVGEGSRFAFQLEFPLVANPTEEQHNGSGIRGYSGPRRRILVVDDVADNRHIIQLYLEMAGFIVSEAAAAHQAITVARKAPLDLVLMDLRMPQVDGVQGARMFREIVSLQQLPIIAISASLEQLVAAKSSGLFCALLHKPITERTLLETVYRVLQLGGVEELSSPPAATPKSCNRSPVIPSPADLQELQQLVVMGRTSKVREWIEQAAVSNPEWQPFLQPLRERLASFDLEGVEALLRKQR